MKQGYYLGVVLVWFCSRSVFADGLACTNLGILDLTARGSVTDTPCVVPNKNILMAGGYQYQTLIMPGILSNFPQAAITVGMPQHIDITVDLPTYYDRRSPHRVGMTATNVGVKKQVYSSSSFSFAWEGIATLPGGSNVYGSDGTGLALNAVGLYNLNTTLSINAMLGGSSLVVPFIQGGVRYNSINYSVALGYTVREEFSLFAEVFGETKPNPLIFAGNGLDWDAGVLYALTEYAVLDVEYADRFFGGIGKYKNYVGAGVTLLFN